MRLMRSALAVAVDALPAIAQGRAAQTEPICQWFYSDGEVGYFPNGGDGYYDEVYGWHQWCQSPVYGWYVLR